MKTLQIPSTQSMVSCLCLIEIPLCRKKTTSIDFFLLFYKKNCFFRSILHTDKNRNDSTAQYVLVNGTSLILWCIWVKSILRFFLYYLFATFFFICRNLFSMIACVTFICRVRCNALNELNQSHAHITIVFLQIQLQQAFSKRQAYGKSTSLQQILTVNFN